jgi:hypothetical protein
VMDWVAVNGFPSYSLNPLGQVRHDRKDFLVRPHVNQRGAVYVALMRHGQHYSRSLAMLVASHFIPQPRDTFDMPINLNGDRFNCSMDNLMWRPRWFAIRYNRQFRDASESHIEAPLTDFEALEVHPNSMAVSQRYGLLERDVVLSVENLWYTWPTYQQFQYA